MSNGVIWMFSSKGGYHPCYDANEVGGLEKNGWVRCGCSPFEHKIGISKKESADLSLILAEPKEQEVFIEKQPDELSKDDLLELAAESGVAVDKRWSAQRIKEALGL